VHRVDREQLVRAQRLVCIYFYFYSFQLFNSLQKYSLLECIHCFSLLPKNCGNIEKKLRIPDRLWRTAASLRWTPARTSSPASPLSRPSMAEPVGDLQPWFIAGKRAVPTPAWHKTPLHSAVHEASFAGTPVIRMLPVATAAGNGRNPEVFLPDLGFSPLPFLPTLPPPSLVFVSTCLQLEGRGVLRHLLCLCTSTEVQRCSLETCVASCQPNHAGQQHTRVYGAVRSCTELCAITAAQL
jgi:hypothetical protein